MSVTYNPLLSFFYNNVRSISRTFHPLSGEGKCLQLIKRVARIVIFPIALVAAFFGILSDGFWKKIDASNQKLEKAKKEYRQVVEETKQVQKNSRNKIDLSEQKLELTKQLGSVRIQINEMKNKAVELRNCIEHHERMKVNEERRIEIDQQQIENLQDQISKYPKVIAFQRQANQAQLRKEESIKQIEQAQTERLKEIESLQQEVEEISNEKLIENCKNQKRELKREIREIDLELDL